MTSHEDSTVPESRLPAFVVRHDGTQPEIPERERLVVAQKFDSLVDDLLLNFAGHVRHVDLGMGMPEDKLLLQVPISDTSHWSIGVSKRTGDMKIDPRLRPDEHSRDILSLQYVEGVYGREAIEYRLGADGVVRRHDSGDAYGTIKQEEALGLRHEQPDQDITVEQAAELAKRTLDDLLGTRIPNERLAQQMGFNDQPIGLPEIDGLNDFLMTQYGMEPVKSP